MVFACFNLIAFPVLFLWLSPPPLLRLLNTSVSFWRPCISGEPLNSMSPAVFSRTMVGELLSDIKFLVPLSLLANLFAGICLGLPLCGMRFTFFAWWTFMSFAYISDAVVYGFLFLVVTQSSAAGVGFL